ncbi:hypothetical protein FSP39_003563 [Pinctada imbricata]|uniref:adenosylmethionine decarboxylase n=1 Tax=Pinctada imbricata TaxID=66713 RepID=A0AA88Y2X6_PINIB|nr:hypothetical protein FSP39_003563 [Pinctada imbricata]
MAGACSHEQFFEGTEKLLEVWFDSDNKENEYDLRNIERKEWEELLKLVKCEIISKESVKDMDAYVLSESSMFVTKKRYILKTCGRTTLLLAVEPLINLVKERVGFEKVVDIFYSRKKFTKPEQQHRCHRNFEDEVSETDGAAYTLGRINGDCWHLYTLDEEGVTCPDQTVEISFYLKRSIEINGYEYMWKENKEKNVKSGIVDIVPGAIIDDFLFDPCGYSMNGLLSDGYYITIHVTPEPHCSYVSFESNVPQENYTELMQKILDIFRPNKFLMTVFVNKASIAKDSHKTMEDIYTIKDYARCDHQFCTFKNYNLTYSHYTLVHDEVVYDVVIHDVVVYDVVVHNVVVYDVVHDVVVYDVVVHNVVVYDVVVHEVVVHDVVVYDVVVYDVVIHDVVVYDVVVHEVVVHDVVVYEVVVHEVVVYDVVVHDVVVHDVVVHEVVVHDVVVYEVVVHEVVVYDVVVHDVVVYEVVVHDLVVHDVVVYDVVVHDVVIHDVVVHVYDVVVHDVVIHDVVVHVYDVVVHDIVGYDVVVHVSVLNKDVTLVQHGDDFISEIKVHLLRKNGNLAVNSMDTAGSAIGLVGLLFSLLCLVDLTESACDFSNGVVNYGAKFPYPTLTRASLVDCPKNATEVDLSSNGITSIENDTFADFYSLQRIILGCSCIEQPYIKQLVVNCTGTRLTSLPDVLPNPMDHDGYITLILDYNRIQHFTLKNYTSKLLNVSMTYNNLDYLEPNALSAMKNATSFNVSHNRLQFVPKAIQFLEFDDIRLNNNPLKCDCNMTWMPDWIKLSPSAPDYNIQCTDKDDDKHLIRDVTDLLLVCNPEIIAIAISIGLAALLAIIIGVVITAKRCPYETKVLLYKFFGIHPSDKYKVDGEENRNYDVYISCDSEDIQARQWLKTVFLPKVEEGKKRKYKVFTPMKDAVVGSDYADDLISSMRKSRRIVFLLTEGFMNNEWNIFETDQAELEHFASDNLHGRVVYILWNKKLREQLADDQWKARMEGKRVLCPDDRFFWSKMRYELPLKAFSITRQKH